MWVVICSVKGEIDQIVSGFDSEDSAHTWSNDWIEDNFSAHHILTEVQFTSNHEYLRLLRKIEHKCTDQFCKGCDW